MRWKNALVLMRKDMAEFRKQKYVIGSIIAMPLVLGVILPMVMLAPLSFAYYSETDWDVEGLVELEPHQHYFINLPFINETLENASSWYDHKVIHGVRLVNASLDSVLISSCIIENSRISNSTIKNCEINNSYFENSLIYHSSGEGLRGKNIVDVGSSLEFIKEKQKNTFNFFPNMFNFVLVMFILLPATLPTLIASYSIVGEKNNKSLEPLLATPTTDSELLTGKILSAFVPTMAATFFAFILCIILLNIFFGSILAEFTIPFFTWFLAVILLAPIVCLMSILACVMISSKVKDVRAAQQLGGFVVIPVFVILIAVMTGFIFLGPIVVVLIAMIFAFIDLGLFYFAKKIFNREDILTKWV